MILALVWSGWAAAAPLTLEDVLVSVDRHAPKLAAMDAKVAEAEGKALSARGAFDPVLQSKILDVTSGAYPRLQADTALVVDTPFGPTVTAGYRVGTGTFPSYYGGYETLDLGEVRVEVATPLLADLGMTAERAKRLVADHALDAAQASRNDVRQQMFGKAAATYWKWVAAGEKLALTVELLALAETRQVGLVRQVEEGAMPPMEAIDNERVVWSRRADQAEAQQVLTKAAIDLSLFFRSDGLEPIVPEPSDLPEATPAPASKTSAEDTLIASALQARPDIAVLNALQAAAQVELQRARSTVLPAVDGTVAWSEDRGPDPDDKLGKPELALGLNVKVPLALRKGRGELARSRAAMDRISAERRLLRDEVSAQVRDLHRARGLAVTRWQHAAAAVERAEKVAELERRAFQLGSSDIFKVTKREETLAKEQKAEINARAEIARIDAYLRSVTADWTTPGS